MIITETLIMNRNVRFDALIVFRCQINSIFYHVYVHLLL